MFRLITRRPSPAMVIACIALLVALGGTAVAAKKLVGGDKLIKKHSLSGNRLRNNTLTGRQINAGSLGKVPSAQSADSAASASNANALGGTPASAFACPSGTALLGGSCIETTERAAADWFAASKTCGAAGRHLPSADQLNSVARNNQLSWTGNEISAGVFYDGTNFDYMEVASGGGGMSVASTASAGDKYRCAVNPVP